MSKKTRMMFQDKQVKGIAALINGDIAGQVSAGINKLFNIRGVLLLELQRRVLFAGLFLNKTDSDNY